MRGGNIGPDETDFVMVDLTEEMVMFDMLPETLRTLLNYCRDRFSAKEFHHIHYGLGFSAEAIQEEMKRQEMYD